MGNPLKPGVPKLLSTIDLDHERGLLILEILGGCQFGDLEVFCCEVLRYKRPKPESIPVVCRQVNVDHRSQSFMEFANLTIREAVQDGAPELSKLLLTVDINK